MPVSSNTKKCGKCGLQKSVDAYHRRSRSKDGLQSYCKECDKHATLSQMASKEGREYRSRWRMSEKGVSSRRSYLESDNGKKKHKENAARHRERHKQKVKARAAVSNAIVLGLLVRADKCSVCFVSPPAMRDGRSALQAHHDDYSKPLDVQWLCVKCHKDIKNE